MPTADRIASLGRTGKVSAISIASLGRLEVYERIYGGISRKIMDIVSRIIGIIKVTSRMDT